jgi:hypothetical protein
MQSKSNKNKDALKDRKLCLLNKQGNRIIIKIGPNTTLTALRDFIKNNASEIKKIQTQIRKDTNTNLSARDRARYNRWRDWTVWDHNKKSIKELRKLIKDPEERRLSENQKYKSIIIAKIMNQDLKSFNYLGETIYPKIITEENVRKIISRQKRLYLKGII